MSHRFSWFEAVFVSFSLAPAKDCSILSNSHLLLSQMLVDPHLVMQDAPCEGLVGQVICERTFGQYLFANNVYLYSVSTQWWSNI